MYWLRPKTVHVPMTPWIESLVLSYSDREGEGAGGPDGGRRTRAKKSWLKAYVLEISTLPNSKPRAFEGPDVVFYLSDGQVKIPAVLTASTWARIQEKGLKNLNNFLNTTVEVQVDRLQFDMTPDRLTSKFYLMLSGLTTVDDRLVTKQTPCYTVVSSIRKMIDQIWSARQRAQDSQRSQDLSQLLRVWQDECLQSSVKDVMERMITHTTPLPSTSAHCSSLTGPATSWDQDRVRYQAETPFTVPVKFLCIPQHLETGTDAGLRTHTGKELPALDDAAKQIPEPAGVASVRDAAGESSPVLTEDDFPQEEVTQRPSSNPWDIFPPLCISSESSPEPTPTPSGTTSGPDCATMVTSTPHVHTSLPPYQKQQTSSLLDTNSADKSSPEPPTSDTTQNTRTHQNLQTLDRDHQHMAQVDTRNPKRKRHDVTLQRVEEEELSHSPPSWLFETQPEPARTEEGSSPKRRVVRTTSSVHSDGKKFSYTYHVSGQNLQDFSRFRVATSVLHWAVKYLLTPEPAEPPPNIS